MTNKNLDLVKKLLTRGGHPETADEEARTCAVKAARIIFEHGFVVSEPALDEKKVNDQPTSRPAQAASRADAAYAAQIMDIFDRQRPKRSRHQIPASDNDKPIVINSRFDGFCRSCDLPYAQGERVVLWPGRGVCHYRCKNYWKASR